MIFWLSYVLLWALAICQLLVIIVVAQRLYQQGREPDAALAVTGPLPTGTGAPPFVAVRLGAANPMSSADFRGAETLLLFLSVDCPDCKRIVAGLEEVKPGLLTGLVIHCTGNALACERHFSRLSKTVPVLMNSETDIPKAYGLSGVPTGVTIDGEWRIRDFHYPPSAGAVLSLLKGLSRQRGAEHDALSANWK
jgi:hypothetical protein